MDVVVIGGGAAGLNGALILARSRRTVVVIDSGTVTARRVLVATGLRDVPPDVPGLAEHWGHGVVHCPYCHGWEVRDEPIGILATGPPSIHHALLFRQLTDDLVYFTHGTDLDENTRARFAVGDIRVIDTPVREVMTSEDGGIAGVRLTDGTVVARRILAVAPA
ncbi:FAD-binding protein [Acrocarpospora pleiomorpha]|uniref:FAD-binding protein n=1 Tax=Acrocarpospora pleiomorpha TaxID=90975 RepID=UPI001FE82678|nr:FAD-binding protein [Acrocarpospora pleiomorpha]